jgi:putative ABC transport system permease protein
MLTGFAISWGIFILIVLLSVGNGLYHGLVENFDEQMHNTVTLSAHYTQLPYKGNAAGRKIRMTTADLLYLSNSFPAIQSVVTKLSVGYKKLSYEKNYAETDVDAVSPAYFTMRSVKLTQGRFISPLDISDQQKVAMLQKEDADRLFKDVDCIGRRVVLDNVAYTVIGVFELGGRSWHTTCYIPESTAKTMYNFSGAIGEVICTISGLNTLEANSELSQTLRSTMSRRHEYDPQDGWAIHVSNATENFMKFQRLFGALNTFLWIIGFSTLIAGIVGVGNIMLMTVKERTKEFGIRKALGAKPASIVRLILSEALCITAFFGYVGLFLGTLAMEIVSRVLDDKLADNFLGMIFKDPSVDMRIAVGATLVLILAGILAGYIPSKRAVAIKPIEALRYE